MYSRNQEAIINDIKELVSKKGYIYSLCLILFEDFHISPEEMHKTDYLKRLSTKEASLLLGFLIQNEIDFTIPESPQVLLSLKNKTYELMEELHKSFMLPFLDKLKMNINAGKTSGDYKTDQKEFFSNGGLFSEPIFYSGTGVYDFQYLEFLGRKYSYDKEWLIKNKAFEVVRVQEIVSHIKEILQIKSQKVRLYHLKETLPDKLEELKKKNPKEDWDKHMKELLPMMELYQYVELFYESIDEHNIEQFTLKDEGLKSFYKGLIELFVIRKSDFMNKSGIDSFFDNFAFSNGDSINNQFNKVGDFNVFNSRPIIKIDPERYFIPITFLLFEAVYENPFYWMWIEDKAYRAQLSQNRGNVGEEITHSFLVKVFGKKRTFKSVKIRSKKGHDETDIDVLCILGSKALCVQIKSKKLTILSRTGDDEQLQKDFKEAVQDAYEQGIVSRNEIITSNSKFIDENGNEIILDDGIDEVYIMCITTENYPSLTHQSHVLLDKLSYNPFPLVLTIFDLELVSHYLDDPYDFLYYVRQRISLMDYFNADEEIVFLGYHLDKKLWKISNNDFVMIESDFGQMVDRNYYPLKAGLDISDEGDELKNRWQNEKFSRLCSDLKQINASHITDIIFQLFDLSGKAREQVADLIEKTRLKTLIDGKVHNFSFQPDDTFENSSGLTYISYDSNDEEKLRSSLLSLSTQRKYNCKADSWIGLGSLKNSPQVIDVVIFDNHIWAFDMELEKTRHTILDSYDIDEAITLKNKIGRNDKCPCGSGKKYKKCCGK